jgi:hypothetical protein
MKPTSHFVTGGFIILIAAALICSCKKTNKDLHSPLDPVTGNGTQVDTVTTSTQVDTVTTATATADTNVLIGNKEIIYKNIAWTFPWYNTLPAPNIHNYVPKGTPIKVFIKRDYSNSWIEVKLATDDTTTELYEYFIETRPYGAGMYGFGNLYIFYYGMDTDDTPDVKITY